MSERFILNAKSGALIEIQSVAAGVPWGEIPDGCVASDTPPPLPSPKPTVVIVYPVDLWERMTQEEADAVGAVMEQQDFRTRKIFESASSYRSDHELWPLLQQIATQLFGEERAAQVLAPSELVPAS